MTVVVGLPERTGVPSEGILAWRRGALDAFFDTWGRDPGGVVITHNLSREVWEDTGWVVLLGSPGKDTWLDGIAALARTGEKGVYWYARSGETLTG